MIKVLFVCHGNICRSTMCESVFTYMVKQAGLEEKFEIDSAATSREEIGNGPHYGTRNKLAQVGIPVIPHRARQLTRDDYLYYDYLIGMDTANIAVADKHNFNFSHNSFIFKPFRLFYLSYDYTFYGISLHIFALSTFEVKKCDLKEILHYEMPLVK